MQYPVTLLIPEKTDVEFDQIVLAWQQRGGDLKRLGKYWVKDDTLAGRPIVIYGNQTFALVLAQIYNVQLVFPDDTLIARLEPTWTKRMVRQLMISELRGTDFPAFIKPVIPKLFLAGIFQTQADFNTVVAGLQDTETILLSDIIPDIQAEARSFVNNGVIADIALYEGAADLTSGRQFLSAFIAAHQNELPEVVVIDIAYSEQRGWFVLEFNACWGAGLNNCNAELVMDCITGATINTPIA